MVRSEWWNLNGLWRYAITPKATNGVALPAPGTFEDSILVPFGVESALSGVKRDLSAYQALWYQRTISIPNNWRDKRIWLRFGAVDWECTVWVNGQEVGSHRGGYDAFGFDVTPALKETGEQVLTVRVYDSESGFQPVGKQTSQPTSSLYSAVSGIWQTVWIEPVPAAHWVSVKTTPELAREEVEFVGELSGETSNVVMEVEVSMEGQKVQSGRATLDPGTSGKGRGVRLVLPMKEARLWSPAHPFLYDARVTLMCDGKPVDTVDTYFGMRSITVGADASGFPKIQLNGRPLFQLGVLDEGYWPEGLYTAPTDEAMRQDLEKAKEFGFNLCRKHVKVEPERWYYWCDKLGLMVWQDMPNGKAGVEPDNARSPETAAQFELELQRMIQGRRNHPSVIGWVIFNQGWGQYDTVRLTQQVRDLDPTRLVMSASGADNHGAGDVTSVHVYPWPKKLEKPVTQALFLGEIGGLGLQIPGHLWTPNAWAHSWVPNREVLNRQYESVLRAVATFQRSVGLSGVVFIQLTDVEQEVTGLMTYDREITKVDVEVMKRVNEAMLRTPVRP